MQHVFNSIYAPIAPIVLRFMLPLLRSPIHKVNATSVRQAVAFGLRRISVTFTLKFLCSDLAFNRFKQHKNTS